MVFRQRFEFEKITLPQALARSAEKYPASPALLFQGTTITFKQLDDMVSKFASALIALVVKPGDKVSMLLPNLVQMLWQFMILAGGAVAVMNNPLYTDRNWNTSTMTPAPNYWSALMFCPKNDQPETEDRHTQDHFLPYP